MRQRLQRHLVLSFAVGILYAAVSILLLVICEVRRKQSNRSFSDQYPGRYDGETLFPSEGRTTGVREDREVTSASGREGDVLGEEGVRPPATDEPSLRPLPTPSPFPSPSPHPTLPSPPDTSSPSPSFPPPPLHSPLSPASTKIEPSFSSPPPTSNPLGPPLSSAPALPQKNEPTERVFGAPFVTASGVVLLFTTVVGLMEVALLVLVVMF